tara:strand:- start:458 stop:1330 length:873 start_codon:yes stop_codon:yes gene_type:complete
MISHKIKFNNHYFQAYSINGDTDLPSVHFSHANGFNALAYKSLLEKISTNHKIVAYDLRGHGFSNLPADPKKLKSWYRYSEDLEGILNQSSAPSTLIGHSMGGTSSLLVALKRPDLISKVILIDPVIMPISYWIGSSILKKFKSLGMIKQIHPEITRALNRKKAWLSKEEAFKYFSGKKLFNKIKSEIIQDYIDGGITKINDDLYELCCSPSWEAANFELTPGEVWLNLKKNDLKIKIILTPNSFVCNKKTQQKLKKFMPQAEIVFIENTTHMLPLENPSTVSKEIINFL